RRPIGLRSSASVARLTSAARWRPTASRESSKTETRRATDRGRATRRPERLSCSLARAPCDRHRAVAHISAQGEGADVRNVVTSGPPGRAVLRLALPTVGAMLAQSIVNEIDIV